MLKYRSEEGSINKKTHINLSLTGNINYNEAPAGMLFLIICRQPSDKPKHLKLQNARSSQYLAHLAGLRVVRYETNAKFPRLITLSVQLTVLFILIVR